MHVTVGNASEPAQAKPTAVAGGFSKFFNRVIDNGLWADLPDCARCVYLPLVRLAEHRGHCRAKVGLASLIRLSGASRSTVKRGLKALQEQRLIVVVSQGGVGADGVNRPNVYELLVPEPRDDDSPTTPTTATTPVRRRTPSRSKAEPTPGPSVDATPVQPRTEPGAADGPHLRGPTKKQPQRAGGGRVSAAPGTETTGADADHRAAAMLTRWGFDQAEATDLVTTFGPACVSRAMGEARTLHDGGKLRCAAGFIRWQLREQSPPMPTDVDAPPQDSGRRGETAVASAPAPTGSGTGQAPAAVVEASGGDVASPADDGAGVEGDGFDGLAPDVVAWAAERVLAAHADRPAMVRLLTSRPPAKSPLMRAEIVNLLRAE